MSWDEYTKAVIRLSLPDGDIEVAPAPLGRIVGRYPEDGRRIHIVSAHNPSGRPASAATNDKGHARLLARIMEAELAHFPAAGGDRTWTHVEAGVAIVGLDDVQAREIGREFGQDAIFEWSPTALAILSCTERRVHYTGWTATPVETPTETTPPPDAPVQMNAESTRRKHVKDYLVKARRDEDFYIVWSMSQDWPMAWGTKADLVSHASDAEFDLADQRGAACLRGPQIHVLGVWEHEEWTFGDYAIAREDLKEFISRIEEYPDDPDYTHLLLSNEPEYDE